MKMLLTSAGLGTTSIADALRGLVGKSFEDTTLAFIPTAANVEVGDKGWLIKDFVTCKELGFNEVDIVDVAALSQDRWEPRLRRADVLVFGGGNTSYLMGELTRSGLAKLLPELLALRVYVGISAGSMVVAPNLREREMQVLFEEPIVDDATNEGLGLVDFLVVPHMDSPYFPRASERIDEVAQGISSPLYALDDRSAVRVVDDVVDVVSEGSWRRYN